MNSNNPNARDNLHTTGVPPVPPEAHQRAVIEYLSCADTAKLVRKALKEAFPDVVFSVRSSTYSMGSSIGVSWTDGPSESLVDGVIGRFDGSVFDGMEDRRMSKLHMFAGKVVSLGADSVRCSRRNSDAAVQRAIDRVCRMYADEFAAAQAEVPTVAAFRSGSLLWMQLPGMFDDLQREIGRVLYKSSDRMAAKNSPTAANMIHLTTDGRAVVAE